MTEVSEPLLVYDRIDANRRATRRLLGYFMLALLPVASGSAVWLMPLLMGPFMMVGASSPALQQSLQQASLAELVALEGGMLLLALGAVTVGMTLGTAWLANRYASTLVLRAAKARPVGREEALELHRVVENLSIGAGLPKPRVHVIESDAPNAFATGQDPEHASIAVSRGLLSLLDRRELEGVVAHELSHIGNHDIRLNTTLAALIGTLTIPLTLITSIFRMHRIFALIAVMMVMPIFGGVLLMVQVLLSDELRELPPIIIWWSLHALLAPVYLVFLAPWVGRLIRRAVSREREFLADADAVLLTRNPEAFALALVKVSAAAGTPIRVGPATEHLYFVDPLDRNASWLARLFRSHPPIEERLELLAGMGSGIRPAALAEARRAGERSRARMRLEEPVDRHEPEPPAGTAVALVTGSEAAAQEVSSLHPREAEPIAPALGPANVAAAPIVLARNAQPGERFRLRDRAAPLYERADGWSPVLETLSLGAVVTARIREDGFLQVSTGHGTVGYLGRNRRLAVIGEEESV